MATVIDSLVVELSLDPKKFTAGQQKTKETFNKMKDDADKARKQMETFTKGLEAAFSGLTSSVLKFTASLLGAAGVTELFVKLNKMNKEVGASADYLGESSEELSKWENAAKRAGGTAEGIKTTFKGLRDEIAQIGIGGTPNSDFFSTLQILGVNFRNFSNEKGELKDTGGFAKAISDALSKVQDPGKRAAYAEKVHITPENLRFLSQQSTALDKMLKDQERILQITKEQTDASRQIDSEWQTLTQQVTNLANILQFSVSDIVKGILGDLTSTMDLIQHPLSSESWVRWFGRWSGWTSNPFAAPTSGQQPSPPGEATPSGREGPATKAGANVPFGLYALATSLGGIPTFNRITSGNDAYHQGGLSKHNEGLALDFTLKNAQQADAVERAINDKFRAMGIDAKAINEYDPRKRSAHATGSHIHVQFASQAALSQFNANSAKGGIEFNIQTLNVQANDPKQLKDAIIQGSGNAQAVKNRSIAAPAQGGFQ